MSEPTPTKRTILANAIFESLEFTIGVSQKTGNKYLVGNTKIKSPISDTPIRLGFEYIDPNTAALIEMALEKLDEKDMAEFKDGLQD